MRTSSWWWIVPPIVEDAMHTKLTAIGLLSFCFMLQVPGSRDLIAIGLDAAPDASNQQATQRRPFDVFRRDLMRANAASYIGREGYRVQDAAAFEEMRQHVLSFYDKIDVVESFVLAGHAVDCIAIDQQPSLKAPGLEHHVVQRVPPPLTDDLKALTGGNSIADDAAGNGPACPPDFVPIRRLELDDIARYRTLGDFLSKDTSAADPATHYHALGYFDKPAIGVGSMLNVWNPVPATNYMSLSQIWVLGGIGDALQSAEAGWQVFPAKYHTPATVLFIFWTSANYAQGSGCYNYECEGFMLVNRSWAIGEPLPAVSVDGGTQVVIGMAWYRDPDTGNWWLLLVDETTRAVTYVGYYPAALYKGGQLSKAATLFEFGGETTGLPNAGQMGSGAVPGQGYQHAAYQNRIVLERKDKSVVNAQLKRFVESPQCYDIAIGNAKTAKDLTYFYFGGPMCPPPIALVR
jgi:Neprosin/Neprosin activation peptide